MNNFTLLLNSNALYIPLPDKSIHCIVTSPPYYGLRSYSGLSPVMFGGDDECEHVWSSRTRLLQTGGMNEKQVTNKGVDGSGWSVQDSVCTLCGGWLGYLGLEPSVEQYVYNIVLIFDELWRVLRDDGIVWLNLGDSYNGSGGAGGDYNKGGIREGQPRYPGRNVSSLKPKDMIGVPWRVAFALQERGWYLRSDVIWAKGNPMPSSVKDRPTSSHEHVFLLAKSRHYYYDNVAIFEPLAHPEAEGIPFYKGAWGSGVINRPDEGRTYSAAGLAGRNKRDVWHINTKPYKGAHFATMPPELAELCIKAGTSEYGVCSECATPWERVIVREGKKQHRWSTGNADGSPYADQDSYQNVYRQAGWRPVCDCYDARYRSDFQQARNPRKRYQRDVSGDWFRRVRKLPGMLSWDVSPSVVLDPFAGSGTTLEVARKLFDVNSIGLDLSGEYLQLARKRLSLDRLKEWENGLCVENVDLSDLPMFENRTGVQ